MKSVRFAVLALLVVAAAAFAYEPTSHYTIQTIEGWKVYVNNALLGKAEHAEVGAKALTKLKRDLARIKTLVPDRPLGELLKVPIWLEVDTTNGPHGRTPTFHYHPGADWLAKMDFHPDKHQCVEFSRAAAYAGRPSREAGVVLHELAHAYHDRVFGFDDPEILAAYKRAVAGTAYPARDWARSNEKEFFCAVTQRYFGPQEQRDELEQRDPDVVKLLNRIWGEPKRVPEPPPPKPEKKSKARVSYNHLFDIRNIEGWTVYVNRKDLAEHAEEMAAALDHLRQQLYHVRLNVPPAAVAIMQEKVPLWFEYDTLGIAYHHQGWLVANGHKPPDVETVVGFCRAKSFLKVTLHQPSVVFHELAHGYDYRYLRRPKQRGHPLLKAAYDKAMKAGEYDPVLCRYSKATKAYGANNPGEFFAENSEAFFGVNDFYPFVRAELKEYDPDTHRALAILWGIDTQDRQRREQALVAVMDGHASPLGWAVKPPQVAAAGPEPAPAQSYEPTSAYRQRRIEGWTVKVGPDLQNRKAYADEVCKLLRYKLHLVKRYVPEKALPALQKVPIWLEANNPAVPYVVYHADKKWLQEKGQNPDKHRAVEIGNTDNFRQWQALQPSIVLHHLARAYLDQVVGAGRDEVSKALARARKSGKYDRVLRFDGKHVRHPALVNAEAYFAEMTESYYGFNDHYPFLQFELSQLDGKACDLLTRLWGGKAK